MQTVRPAAPGHHASGELIDDYDLAILYHVFDIVAIESMGFDRGLNVVLPAPVFRIGNVSDA